MSNCYVVTLLGRPCAVFPSEREAAIYVSGRLADNYHLNQSDFGWHGVYIAGLPF